MATRRVETGPTGETVRTNIANVRRERQLTLRELSDLLAQGGRPMAHNTLSEIERGARRIDVDDLMAIAIALDVAPNVLFRPDSIDVAAPAEVTGSLSVPSVRDVYYFLEGFKSLANANNLEFALRCLPQFMTIRRTTRRTSWSTPGRTWIYRAMETDGDDVQWSAGESTESVLAQERDDD